MSGMTVLTPGDIYYGRGHRFALLDVQQYSADSGGLVPLTGAEVTAYLSSTEPTPAAPLGTEIEGTTVTLVALTDETHSYAATLSEDVVDPAITGRASVWEVYDGENIRCSRLLRVRVA